MRKLLLTIFLAACAWSAAAQSRFATITDTNGVLLSPTNFFAANSNLLNGVVGGVNTNLSGVAVASGTVTLDHGTSLVNSVWAYTTNRFLVTYRANNGILSLVGCKQITNGVSFVLFSNDLSDTNQVDYAIIRP